MERRVLLAIFLAFLVIYVYQALLVKLGPGPADRTSGPAARPVPAAGAAPEATSPTVPPVEPDIEPSAAPSPVDVAALVGDTAERDIRIETSNVTAVFTNRGARLKSWRLKRHLDREGRPEELIEQELGEQARPFELRTGDERLDAALNGALYVATGVPVSPVVSQPLDLRFEYRDSTGLHAVKRFHLDPASYILGFEAEVMSGDRALSPAVIWGPAIGDTAERSSYAKEPEGLMFQGGEVLRLSSKDLAGEPTHEGDFEYAGVENTYFMTTVLSPGPTTIRYEAVSLPPPAGSTESARNMVSYSVERKNGDGPLRYFVGPKEFDVLAAISPDFTRAIDFGMFAVIVVPLLRALKWVNAFVGNYGWSIIVLTVFINVLLFPLNHKSIVSMRKMQELQPQMKAIQERYSKLKATDPAKQKMNQELMGLYRERGVNPASGCVPTLLTFPVFLAMWALLSTAIELRGAPFILWIHDLTARDPFYVTPVLMGLTQFWQQRMTPMTGADPAQQKMFMIMPVVMTVMFLTLPVGALIYYTASGVLRIGQQYLTNYLIGPPTVRAVRPPAERRVKRVGGGKTEAADANAKR